MTQDVALLQLPQELIDALGDYGCARSDGVSESVRLHRWQLVFGRIKEYARACVEANVGQLRASLQSASNALSVESEARADAEWKVVQLAEEVLAARSRAERLAEALREAREYVASELAEERAKFAGYEHCSTIASIEADLARIDALLTPNAAQPGETT